AIGGVNIGGDDAQFKQEHRISGDWFGGIEDLHYESSVRKGTLTIDGHSIFDTGDHNWRIDFTQTGVGYVRGGYTAFRSWYDGNGGFFSDTGLWIPPAHHEDELDRGEAWIELGLRMPKLRETDDRRQLERGALQLPPLVVAPGAQRFITHRDMNESDSFNGHFTLETHLSDTLWFTTAYFYNTSSADIAGTRIIGSDYNSM